MSNQADAIPITSAPFLFRLFERKKKKKKKKTEKEGEKKREKSQIDPATLHRYYRASVVLRGLTSSSGRDSRAEFLTTARILSLAGQLAAGISRERIDFSSHRPSRPRCISIPIHPTPFVASFSPRLPSPSFPPTPSGFHLTPLYILRERVRFGGESFSSLRNATLRPLFSRRISPIFRFLFRVPRTTGAGCRAAPLSWILENTMRRSARSK